MALLKAFVCQVVLLGLYKLFLEQIFEDYLVPDELIRNCLVGFVCLLCFGIQLYTEKVEEQTGRALKDKSRRRTPPDTAETHSEFLDERTAHMMRTLDAAMKHMSQLPMSDGYVQNVIFTAAGPEAAVIEQTFVKQPDVVVLEEVHMTKLSDAIYPNEKSDVFANEPIFTPINKTDETEKEVEEEESEEEAETKSDICEEEEDVVTVIDTSKTESTNQKKNIEATESEEEEEEEEEEVEEKTNQKIEEKPKPSQVEVEEEEEEEEEVEEEEEIEEKESVTTDIKKNQKIEEKPNKPSKVEVEEDEEEEEEEESEEEQDDKPKKAAEKVTKKS